MQRGTSRRADATRPSTEFALYYLLFFLSGATALAYEALWLRKLALDFGATAAATSATLGTFMAGLGIGGYLGARIVTRHRAPLLLYGVLELGVALAALLVEPLFDATSPLLTWIYRTGADAWVRNLTRVAISLAVLLPPTLLMGATLPALAQAVVRSRYHASRSLGLLYGFNTLGAALGVFVTGFVLIAQFGVNGTRVIAIGANVLVGIVALAAHWRFNAANAASTAGGAANEPGKSDSKGARAADTAGLKDVRRRSVGWPLLAAYATSGAVALACEVVWTRALVFFTGSTTYAFTMMLAVLLVGLAIGGVTMGRLGDRIERPYTALAVVLGGIVLSTTAGFAMLPRVAGALAAWTLPDPSWERNVLASAAIAMSAVLLPAAGFGAVFPLVAREAIRRGHAAGAAAGRAYACNLAGAVAGAYLAGFVLIPAMGLSGTLRLLAVILCLTALFLVWREDRRLAATTGSNWRVPHAVLTTAFIIAAMAGPIWLLADAPLHVPASGESLVYYAEGSSATVSVLRDQTGAKTIYIDRISVAGTDPVMQTDQKSLAHLPMLLHQAPTRVLTVGFGSGGASWSYTRYPELEQIDCVEIAPEVVAAAPHLREANHDVFGDPRYRVILDDARAYLRHTDERYDVIATDCTDLRYKGNASLYTSEYFGLCRKRLRPNGLVVVWMPLGGLSEDVFRLAVNTFTETFPQVSVWYMNNYPTHYLLLVGSEAPHPMNWDRLLDRLEQPAIRADLESVALADPFRLLGTFLLDDATVRRFVAGAATNSDAWPRLEFFAPRSADLFSGARNLQTLIDLAAAVPTAPALVTRYGEAQHRTVLDRLQPYLNAAALLNRGHVKFQSGRQEFEPALEYYRRAASVNPNDPQIRTLIASTVRTRDQVLAAYRTAAAATPDDPGVLHNLGLTLLAAGHAPEAVTAFRRLVALEPALVDAHVNLSRAARAAGETDAAHRSIAEASRLAPDRFDVQFQLGLVAQDRGDLAGALAAYQRAAALNPRLAEAHFNAGMVLTMQERLEEAQRAYAAGLRQDPSASFARINYAQVLLMLGDQPSATTELRRVAAENSAAAAKAKEILETLARR